MKNTQRAQKNVAASRTETITLMTPDMANFGGNVHGGHVLRLIDQIAYVCASQYSGHYCTPQQSRRAPRPCGRRSDDAASVKPAWIT